MGRAERKIRPRGALADVVLGVGPAASEEGTRLLIGSGLAGIRHGCRVVQERIDFSVGMAGIGGDRFDFDACNRFNLIDFRLDPPSVIWPVVTATSRTALTLTSTAMCGL